MVLTLGNLGLSIFAEEGIMGWGSVAIANPGLPRCKGLLSGEAIALQTVPQVKDAKANASSATHFPPPSLWWAKDQFDPFGGRLLEKWKPDVNLQQIDLWVNRQLWSTMDYVTRYQFVNKFGTIARESRYNLRVLNAQNKCLAIYYCRFDAIPNQCELLIETVKSSGFRVEPPRINGSN